ncbi:factor activating pos9 [Orbilia ellipsospora]|uniref:Adenylate kinase isoenzyme 6 homolog n=1 Tax=Orbilia ellipsospora TaxID=2528407 RepID=A0AAV9XHK4_9PEZI
MTKLPNIIITGTPGTGKSTHCELLAESTGLKHLSINQIAKDNDCYESFDEELKSWTVDEDKLLDTIEDDVKKGGYIIDWHVCDIFPKSWIDLVVVLRTDNTLLFDRLKTRDYSDKKIEENIDAEIMQVILEEARDAYDEEIVIELQSNESEEIESNVERITSWFEQWKKNNNEGED